MLLFKDTEFNVVQLGQVLTVKDWLQGHKNPVKYI